MSLQTNKLKKIFLTNLIEQQHQMRISKKFVGADTGKQL